MWYKDLFIELKKISDEKQSIKMGNYMQNKFKFLGIPKPKLNEFIKPYLKESKKYDFDWNFIDEWWNSEYRECQYIAIEYLNKNINNIYPTDIDKIEFLITNKSWWETVDSLDSIIGELVIKDNTLENKMLKWSVSDNLWLRRVSIDYQQRYKEDTNTKLLEKIIVNNLEDNEFFINKAIGWSLRDYSKTNKEWVKKFIEKYENRMDKLSIKEASKYL